MILDLHRSKDKNPWSNIKKWTIVAKYIEHLWRCSMLLGFLRHDMKWLDNGDENVYYNQIGPMLQWLLGIRGIDGIDVI